MVPALWNVSVCVSLAVFPVRTIPSMLSKCFLNEQSICRISQDFIQKVERKYIYFLCFLCLSILVCNWFECCMFSGSVLWNNFSYILWKITNLGSTKLTNINVHLKLKWFGWKVVTRLGVDMGPQFSCRAMWVYCCFLVWSLSFSFA